MMCLMAFHLPCFFRVTYITRVYGGRVLRVYAYTFKFHNCSYACCTYRGHPDVIDRQYKYKLRHAYVI